VLSSWCTPPHHPTLCQPGDDEIPVAEDANEDIIVHATGWGKNGVITEKFWSTKDEVRRLYSFPVSSGACTDRDCAVTVNAGGGAVPSAAQ
jgi:hypothetical protein